MIPNIIHFIFGLKNQTEEFSFIYFISILSAYLVNKPDKIYFYYHYEPFGKYWEKIKNFIELVKVELPTHIGTKKIIHFAHKADKLRMDILFEKGGIYMDIDTISIKTYKNLLNKNCVLGLEYGLNNKINGICNAIMLSEPKSQFFKKWMELYESNFKTDGWGESSIALPYQIYQQNKELVYLLKPEIFFYPSWFQTKNIFRWNCNKIPEELLTLHLWEKHSERFFREIKDLNWLEKRGNTMYGLFLKYLIENYNLEKFII
jgi:hypothetical protein